METNNRAPSGGGFIIALIFFVLTAAIAIFMLLAALLVWLSALTGSPIIATLILAGTFSLIAALIYLLSVREGVERIRTQIETVYDVAQSAKMGYEWIVDKALMFLAPLSPRKREHCCEHDKEREREHNRDCRCGRE